jgi:hypothetical protein
MVVLDVLAEDEAQVPLAEWDDVPKALPYCPNVKTMLFTRPFRP